MNEKIINPQIEAPEAGSTSIRLGPAFLRPAKEKDHYELMRPIITVTNEGDRIKKEQHPEPIGPLAVYRIARNGDKPDPGMSFTGGPSPRMKTTNPITKQPMNLVLVWWPQKDE